jgi:hypothetical protein
MKDIYENWNIYKEEVELLQELENIFLEHGDEDMLNENIMAKVVEKINDFILKLSMKVVQLAAKAKSKALSLLSGAAGVVNKFSKKYPNLAKGLAVVIGIGIMTTVMTISPDAAQADLVFQGQVVTEDQANAAVKGLSLLAESADPNSMMDRDFLNAAEHIQDLVDAKHGTAEAEKIKGDLGEVVRGALEKIKKYESEDPELFNKMVKAGEDLAVISPDGSYGSLEAVDMSMFQGKDNIFDAVKGYILDTTEVATGLDDFDKGMASQKVGNKNLLDLYNWRETGEFPEGASQKLKNMVSNFEKLGQGDKLGGTDMKSDRLEMMKKFMDIGKNNKVTISTNKGALQL